MAWKLNRRQILTGAMATGVTGLAGGKEAALAGQPSVIDTEFKQMKFSEIKHKLPKDSWANWRNEIHKGEFDNETVLYRQGDVVLPNLDLDDPLRASKSTDATPESQTHIFLILVEGNLQVDSHIYNGETDGATGLIVLGNLSARNIVVGGQQIYATGNLDVRELFWGDYNHGQLTVKGDANFAVLLDTDYSVEITGKTNFKRHISESSNTAEKWRDMMADDLREVFVADCVVDDDERPSLWRGAMLKHFEADKPVILLDKLVPGSAGPIIPSVFADREVSLANIERLTMPSLLLADGSGKVLREYAFWSGDIYCRVQSNRDAATADTMRSVYLQDLSQHAVRFAAHRTETKQGLWSKLTKQTAGNDWTLSSTRRLLTDEKSDWQAFDAVSPEPFRTLATEAWNILLDGASTYEYARALIAPQQIRDILALPLAKPYDDFYDIDRNGLWLGSVHCAFQQEGALFEGAPQPAMFRVSREYKPDTNELFFYTVQKHLDGTECVFIEYKTDEDDDERIALSYLGGELLTKAAKYFRLALRNMTNANEDLLDGEAPNEDDEFALKYWRKEGYLHSK